MDSDKNHTKEDILSPNVCCLKYLSYYRSKRLKATDNFWYHQTQKVGTNQSMVVMK